MAISNAAFVDAILARPSCDGLLPNLAAKLQPLSRFSVRPKFVADIPGMAVQTMPRMTFQGRLVFICDLTFAWVFSSDNRTLVARLFYHGGCLVFIPDAGTPDGLLAALDELESGEVDLDEPAPDSIEAKYYNIDAYERASGIRKD